MCFAENRTAIQYREELVHKFDNKNGFTIIEIIAVLWLLGILSAFAVSRFTSTNSDIVIQKDITLNHLSYAQIKAMSTNTPWYINFSKSNNSYELFKNGETTPRAFPGEDNPTMKCLSLSITDSGSTVSYNPWGKPFTDTGANTPQAGDRTLTFTNGGGTSKTITIVEDTGLLR